MLPLSRILSACAVGLGCALTTAGLLIPHLLPQQTLLPDLGPQGITYTLRDPAAHLMAEVPERGALVERTHITTEEPSTGSDVTVRAGRSLSRQDQAQPDFANLVAAEVWNYRIDRRSGMPLGQVRVADQIVLPPRDYFATAGWWFFDPADLRADTVEVLDPDLREAVPARRVGVERRDGRQLVHLRQEYRERPIAAGQLQDVTRDLWVDAASGLVLDLAVDVHRYVEDRSMDLLVFQAQLDDAAKPELYALSDAIVHTRVPAWVAWVVTGAGVIIVVIGVVGALAGFGRKRPGVVKSAGEV